MPPLISKNDVELETGEMKNDVLEASTGSKEALPTILDLHDTLPTQVGIRKAREELKNPKNSLDGANTIEFNISSEENEVIDVYNTLVYLEATLTKADDTDFDPAGDDRKVGFVSGLGTALFKGVNVRLNNTLIASSDNLYPYRADLENMLFYSKETKQGSLPLTGYDRDYNSRWDDVKAVAASMSWGAPTTSKVPAFHRRWAKSKLGRNYKVLTRIHSEIFDQGKILPPKSKLDLSFLLVDNKNFVILTNQATPYKVTLQKMQLLVRYITIDESIINEMEYITTRGDNMVMPLRKVEMSYFTKQAHTRDWSELNLVKEGKTLPRRLFIAFVPQANFQGDAKLDPFDYHPSNIERVVLRIGGQIMPFPELYCTPAGGDNRNVVWPLYALLKTCNSFLEERDIGLTVENYTKGNFVLGFDLTSGSAPLGEAFEMPNESSIQLEIKLSAAPANAHTMIVYAEYDGELEIDRTGKVMMYE